jgi:hypothetical protein
MADKNKIEINQDNIVKVLNTIQDNIMEERALALERFKRQDENIDSNEQFIMQGKILAEYLRLAQSCTDSLFNIAKLQASIVYKNDVATGGSTLSHDDIQKLALKALNDNNDSDTVNDIEVR